MRRQASGMVLWQHAPLWNAGEEEQVISFSMHRGKCIVSKIRVDSL